MIKDIHKIREELVGFVEVESDYDFPKNIVVKYLTIKDGDEGFCKGGKFKCRGNNSLILQNNMTSWPAVICHMNKDASVHFTTRFFIPENEKAEENQSMKECKKNKELEETIQYQQGIIETMTDTIKMLEMQKHQISSDKTDYEELLEKNRHHLKDLSVQLRESQSQNEQYKDIIQKLSQSHPMMR